MIKRQRVLLEDKGTFGPKFGLRTVSRKNATPPRASAFKHFKNVRQITNSPFGGLTARADTERLGED